MGTKLFRKAVQVNVCSPPPFAVGTVVALRCCPKAERRLSAEKAVRRQAPNHGHDRLRAVRPKAAVAEAQTLVSQSLLFANTLQFIVIHLRPAATPR